MQTIFGILGGIGPDPEDLAHMKRTADRLFGDDYLWSIFGACRHQMNFFTMGAIMGGNVRVGLEDSISLGGASSPGPTRTSSIKIRRILEDLCLERATPDEARAMLALKGGDRVGF